LFLGLGVSLPLLGAAMLVRAGLDSHGQILERRRSWYGALRVTQLDVGRLLTHGRIRHGMQLADPARAHWPTMYFGPGTAVAQVLSTHGLPRPRRLGVVGLGIGTLAASARAGDDLTFYELDPDVLDVAQHFFSFLRDSAARVHFVLGDGRLSLARGREQAFDVLVLDAFASDAVPAHLLTREAFAVYLRQLAPGGVLLANVSNRHLAVDRVVRAAAAAHGLACAVVQTPSDVQHFVSKVRWAVMARTEAQLAHELAGLTPAAPSGSDVLWTDARASLWSIVK
jgi:SAM-dependent methyltransferase